MQQVTHSQGRLVAVGPGLVDVELAAGRLLSQLAFAMQHRFRIEVRGSGPLAGARGRISAEFVVAGDGSVADHEVVLFVHHPEGGFPS